MKDPMSLRLLADDAADCQVMPTIQPGLQAGGANPAPAARRPGSRTAVTAPRATQRLARRGPGNAAWVGRCTSYSDSDSNGIDRSGYKQARQDLTERCTLFETKEAERAYNRHKLGLER